jgi:hypothetical protein
MYVDPAAPPPGTVVRKRRSRVALGALTALAVLSAGTFAAVALTRPDGAGSPEAAVESLFEALGNEDAIGVMESLPPGERDVLLEPMVATVGELQRLGLLSSFTLDDVPGTDIAVDGLTVESTPLGDGVATVRVTGGTITGTVIPDQVPIGQRLKDLGQRSGTQTVTVEPGSSTESLADAGIEMVAIEEDGGWHVSLFYTMAEAIRGDDSAPPAFGQGFTPIGADTPEGAVRQMVQAGLDLDLAAVIGNLPPDEMRVLYDYGPMFKADADAAAAEVGDVGITLNRLDLRADGDGDTRRVSVTGLDVSGGDDESSGRFTYDGSCMVVEATGTDLGNVPQVDGGYPGGSGGGRRRDDDQAEPSTQRIEVCGDGRTTMTVDGEEVDVEEMTGGLDPSLFNSNVAAVPAITVVERDGRWYVSPTRTMFDVMLTALRGIEGADIDQFFESMDSFLTGGLGELEELEELEGFDPSDPSFPTDPDETTPGTSPRSPRSEPGGRTTPGTMPSIPGLPEMPEVPQLPDGPGTEMLECMTPFDELGPDSTPQEVMEASEAVEACMEALEPTG